MNERLEGIREEVKEIMKTPYAARKEKAEEVGIDLVMTGKVDYLIQEVDLLNEENQRHKQALEFYEKWRNYQKPIVDTDNATYLGQSPIERDKGEKARQSLAGDPNET